MVIYHGKIRRTNHQLNQSKTEFLNLTKLWWNLNITQFLNPENHLNQTSMTLASIRSFFERAPTFTNFPSLRLRQCHVDKVLQAHCETLRRNTLGSARHPVLITGYNMLISWVPPPPPQKMPSQRWRVGIPLKNTLSTSSTPRVRSGTLFLTQDSGISKSGRSEITMIFWGIIAIIVK